MDPIELLLAALTAGAAAAIKGTASQAVKDAYGGLKALIQQHFVGKPQAELALAEYEKDADTWKKPLQKSLAEAGVDQNGTVLTQAQQVLKLVQPQQVAQGKFNIQISESKGIVIGDQAQVKQHFGKE